MQHEQIVIESISVAKRIQHGVTSQRIEKMIITIRESFLNDLLLCQKNNHIHILLNKRLAVILRYLQI